MERIKGWFADQSEWVEGSCQAELMKQDSLRQIGLTYHNFSVQILATAWGVQQMLPPSAHLAEKWIAAQPWVWLLRCVEGPEWKTVMLAHLLVGYCDGPWYVQSKLDVDTADRLRKLQEHCRPVRRGTKELEHGQSTLTRMYSPSFASSLKTCKTPSQVKRLQLEQGTQGEQG